MVVQFLVLVPLTVALLWVIVVLVGIPIVGLTAFIIQNGTLIAILVALLIVYNLFKRKK